MKSGTFHLEMEFLVMEMEYALKILHRTFNNEICQAFTLFFFSVLNMLDPFIMYALSILKVIAHHIGILVGSVNSLNYYVMKNQIIKFQTCSQLIIR